MESSSKYIPGSEIPVNREIGIILTVLESGNMVELPATGFSMFPALRPGDRVIVKPVSEELLPVPGDVVVLSAGNGFVMHRLVKVYKVERHIYITRGDSTKENDNAWQEQQLTGIAISFKRKGKEWPVKNYIPGELRYTCNRWFLWFYNKFNISLL